MDHRYHIQLEERFVGKNIRSNFEYVPVARSRNTLKKVNKENHGKSYTENRYSYPYYKRIGDKLQIFRHGIS